MREICKSGSEGGAGQTNVPFLPLSLFSLLRGSAIRDKIIRRDPPTRFAATA